MYNKKIKPNTGNASMSAAKLERQRLKPEDRRNAIVEATVSALAAHGPQRCTLRQVARDMNVAPSLITYFFATWSDLLLHTYRALIEAHEADIEALRDKYSEDAEANMDLYLKTFFSKTWTSDRIAGAHISLWALARGDVDLGGEMSRTTRVMKGQTAPLIRTLTDARGSTADPGAVNEAFYALTSGLWYEIAVNPAGLKAGRAIKMSWAYLNTAIPQRTESVA